MPQSPRESSAPACWSCDRVDDRAIAVTLRDPEGREATICLCRRCYGADYVPLAASCERRGVAIRPDPATLVLLPPAADRAPPEAASPARMHGFGASQPLYE